MMHAAFILSTGAFEETYGAECLDAVRALAHVPAPPLTTEQMMAAPPSWLAQLEVLFTGWGGPRLDAALLERLPCLRAVFYGAGTLRFTVTDACWARDLVFANAAALNAIPTAEFAFAAIVLALKRTWSHAALTRQVRAFPVPLLPVPGARGSTVGLVALGQVGRRVAERLTSLDVQVLAHDPFASPSVFAELGVRRASLEEVFSQSDVVSLHAPLLPATQGLVDARLLGLMRPGATLLNTARGGLVREADLVATLRTRPDLHAVIDVTEPEPPSGDSAFYDLPNVFLTPHIAGSLGRECRRMGLAMVEEFRRFLVGAPLQHRVTRESYVLMA